MVLACSSIIWRLEDVDIFAANFVLYERNVIAVLLNVLKLNLTKVLVQKSRTGLILAKKQILFILNFIMSSCIKTPDRPYSLVSVSAN